MIISLNQKIEKKKRNERLQEAIVEGETARRKMKKMREDFEKIEKEFYEELNKVNSAMERR